MSDFDTDENVFSDIDDDLSLTSDHADSPSDGYFTQRRHPQQEFVQSSSLATDSEAKSRDGAPSQTALPGRRPSWSSPASPFHPSPAWATDRTPLLDADPPPPDYNAAIAHRWLDEINPTSSRRAPTPDRWSPAEEHEQRTRDHVQWILADSARRAPQSMRDAHDIARSDGEHDAEDQSGRRDIWKPSRRRRFFAVCCNRGAVFNITLVVVAIICVAAIVRIELRSDDHTGEVEVPHVPEGPNIPSDGDTPQGSPGTVFPAHPISPGCTYDAFTHTSTYDFVNVHDFSFAELMEVREKDEVKIGGNVWIGPAPDDQDSDIRISLSFATTAGLKVATTQVLQDRDSLVLRHPKLTKQGKTHTSRSRSCLDVAVAIEVKRGVRMENWASTTSHLNIQTHSELFQEPVADQTPGLHISESSIISSTHGAIHASNWSSRRTELETVSGTITGTIALRDLLSIKTRSGTVSINVDPKEADPDHPAPAEFKASAGSGSMRVIFPLTGPLPDREYQTQLEGTSSSITGDYILGHAMSYRTVSGSADLTLLPFAHDDDDDDDDDRHDTLTTEDRSGSLRLAVLEPHAGRPLTHLRSVHRSTQSGSAQLRYPAAWAGRFDGRATTGSMRAHGPDVQVEFDGDVGPGGKRVVGRKGVGDSRIEFECGSGSVDLGIGD